MQNKENRYGVSGGFGWSPLTNIRTHSGMISLSTCTTVPSTWSSHITVSFLRTYKGCIYAPRVFIIDQNFLNSFFLIPQFLLWASCPWPNHWCLTHVTQHRKLKQQTHSCLSPSSSAVSFPWPEWLTSTPVVTLMASLSQLKLQALYYDILPSTTAVFSYAIGSRKLS